MDGSIRRCEGCGAENRKKKSRDGGTRLVVSWRSHGEEQLRVIIDGLIGSGPWCILSNLIWSRRVTSCE